MPNVNLRKKIENNSYYYYVKHVKSHDIYVQHLGIMHIAWIIHIAGDVIL